MPEAAWNFPILRILQWLGSHSHIIPELQSLWSRLQAATTWVERYDVLLEFMDLLRSIIDDFPDLTESFGDAEDQAETQAAVTAELKAQGFNPLVLFQIAKFIYDLWRQFNPKNATAFAPETNPT